MLLITASFSVYAERLPVKTYTTADGLPRDKVVRIVQDSHGFLWFCTMGGLSRFDGYQFTTYGTDQGLPHPVVNDFLETRRGMYWVATNGAGLCRFNVSVAPPAAKPKFVAFRVTSGESPANAINMLLEDRAGAIWCGTDDGLYRFESTDGGRTGHFVAVDLPREGPDNLMALLEDRQGALWVGTRNSGLYRRWPDGRTERYTTQHGLPSDDTSALLADSAGRLWVGTTSGLCRLVPAPDPSRPVVARRYTTRDGLPNDAVTSLLQSSDGRLWIGTAGGLSELIAVTDIDRPTVQSYTTAHGLSDTYIRGSAEDRDGNLWVGTEGGGVMKIARDGFTSYNEADGLGHPPIRAIFETQAGELCVISDQLINRFDGRRFTTAWPNIPKHITPFGGGWHQITLQDRAGEWWVPTAQGLCRFPKVGQVEQLAQTRPKAVYTTREGMPEDWVFRLFEDSRGDLWISTAKLTRWERATETFHTYSEPKGLVSAYGEDHSGYLWMGFPDGGLARYRAGRFQLFTAADGWSPTGFIRGIHLDQAGRLWIATLRGGLTRIDDPGADRPHFVVYTTAQGLTSNQLLCITEDRRGRIYVGTGRGIDRLDPATGRVKHYTTADGLTRGELNVAFRERQGALWFGSQLGLSRLVPGPDRPPSLPPILIRGVRIAGISYPVSDVGEAEVPEIELAAQQNHIQIDFVGLSFAPGEVLRYQYKLEGIDRDWSTPTDERTIHYAGLSPGSYRFAVRAVNTDGLASPQPATMAFTILPPIWQRGWFIALVALLVGLIIYAFYRSRLTRLLELERVRTRIATDLHDDIGASLSGMALLSDVVKRRMEGVQPESAEMVTELGESARKLVDAMSDIVWSIDPRRDDLFNLVMRVRQFATQMLDAKGIAWNFEAPPEPEKVKLSPEQRRHLFLIFKEAIHNIVRHARCHTVALSLHIANGQILAEIRDDGCGFSPSVLPEPGHDEGRGNGLSNMQSRAAELGGGLNVDSAPGRGTRLNLRVPLKG